MAGKGGWLRIEELGGGSCQFKRSRPTMLVSLDPAYMGCFWPKIKQILGLFWVQET